MFPFPPFDPAAITAEVDTIPGCHNFRGSTSFGLLQSDDATILCGAESQEAVNVVDVVDALAAAVRIKRPESDIFPWWPCDSCERPSSPPASPIAFPG